MDEVKKYRYVFDEPKTCTEMFHNKVVLRDRVVYIMTEDGEVECDVWLKAQCEKNNCGPDVQHLDREDFCWKMDGCLEDGCFIAEVYKIVGALAEVREKLKAHEVECDNINHVDYICKVARGEEAQR